MFKRLHYKSPPATVFTRIGILDNGDVSRIIKGLYVGSYFIANDTEWLKRNKIESVLNVCEYKHEHTVDSVQYYDYPLEMPFGRKTLPLAMNAVAMLNNLHRELDQRVLVHCFAGIDRSPTVVSRYLQEYHNMTDAHMFVSKKRSISTPHPEWWSV